MTAAVYDRIGVGYAARRRPDLRIAARIDAALGWARTVLNVGAGSRLDEPLDRDVVAVEPSMTMIGQRPAGAAPAVQAVAERLPFPDGSFDAALAVITIHHWPDLQAGLAELRRVARRLVLVTFDPSHHDRHWLIRDYLPEVAGLALPSITSLGATRMETVEVLHDCTDRFLVAPWRNPEEYLDPAARAAMSGLALIDQRTVDAAMRRLAADLRSGEWARRYGDLLDRETLDVGLRIVG